MSLPLVVFTTVLVCAATHSVTVSGNVVFTDVRGTCTTLRVRELDFVGSSLAFFFFVYYVLCIKHRFLSERINYCSRVYFFVDDLLCMF